MNRYTLPPGIVKVCAGLVQSAETEPYLSAVARAEQSVWASCPAEQLAERQRLIAAIKENLTKPRNPSIENLLHKHDLHISESTFRRTKRRFCWTIAEELGLVAARATGNTRPKS